MNVAPSPDAEHADQWGAELMRRRCEQLGAPVPGRVIVGVSVRRDFIAAHRR